MYALTSKGETKFSTNLIFVSYSLEKIDLVWKYFNQNRPLIVFYIHFSQELIFIYTSIVIFFIQTDLLPPRPMDTNASFFHPQLLFLRLPEDNYNVEWYRITINGHRQYVYSTEYYWPKHLEPGTNHTVRIVAYCWWSESYRKSSTYNGYIQTQRKHKTFCIMLCPIFINKRLKKIQCKLKQ